MTRVRHLFPTTSSRSETSATTAFFMRNEIGNTLSFYTIPQSRYEGWYVEKEKGFQKIVERIELVSEGANPVATTTNTGHTSFWEYTDGTRIGWKQLTSLAGFTAVLSKPATLKIRLDIRDIYSFPTFGRKYVVTPDDKGYLVTYSDIENPKPVYVHLRSSGTFSLQETWEKCDYPRDVQRNSEPGSLYAFAVATVTTDLLAIGTGPTADEAKRASLAAAKQRPGASPVGINYSHDTLLNEVTVARTSVVQSLRWLHTEKGIWAGLPWFHQVWTRDELITALGLSKEEQAEIIERYLGLPLIEGELPTYLGSGTTCADGVGWLCLLVREYGISSLSEVTQERLLRLLKKAHQGLSQSRTASHGLIYSGHNATWMDTIGREGYRLEIQCMYGLLLEELYELTSDERYEQERVRFKGIVKHQFMRDGYLYDGLGDSSVRPNMFIAYLLQPDLLSASLWQHSFDLGLSQLRTDWGGLTSLSSSHPDFHPVSTGEDNQSYHNGDSWFFVNNLAAIALIRLNQRRYGKVIVDLLQGSTHEILWHNYLGQPGEISSASTLDSFGCGIQAFSGGTYLALLHQFEDYSAAHDRDSISFFWDATAPSTSESFLR